MQEKWTKWEPVAGLAPKYDVESIVDNHDGLTVTLVDTKNDKNKVSVVFTGRILSYRWADETYMDQRVRNLFQEYGSKFFCEWTLFKVTNSEYAKYISETSGTLSDVSPFTHFVFVTNELLFEVLYSYEPKIQFLNLQ